MRFGNALKLLRITESLTMREMADQIGVSASTLCRVENGKACDMRSLGRIMAWLFTDATKEPTNAK